MCLPLDIIKSLSLSLGERFIAFLCRVYGRNDEQGLGTAAFAVVVASGELGAARPSLGIAMPAVPAVKSSRTC